MSDLSEKYHPKEIEEKWLNFWQEKKLFVADPNSSKPGFSIVIPPPNVTGNLHMGHALVNTLQDIVVRWKRMQGFETLWVPGTDHAGIATQTVVERNLMAKEGKRRTEYDRESFVKKIWEWKENYEKNILGQLRRLGSSCDWSRLGFTLDETRSKAVRTLFKKLYDDKLIYRGDYLVNWDPVTETALADDEVEYEERSGFMWQISYPLKETQQNGQSFITVATTRPETMLGDVAVAVSPNDERYNKLIGKLIKLPLTNREIPIIADNMVDPAFGTGAVKITPAHDANDYEVALRHKLPMINLLEPNGTMNSAALEFKGLNVKEARAAVVAKLKTLGLLEKATPHINRVGVSYRSKADIEPYLSKQWFMKLSKFQSTLSDAVTSGDLKLVPKQFESTYFHWANNLRDWCISRQLWWGHQIPIWYRKDDRSKMLCYAGDGLPPEVEKEPGQWVQDEDVLDTWFSSALWPFSTMGWPEKTPEMEKFYPNSLLITGHDILFFWVARMVVMGKYTFDKLPFPTTFLHGLIYGKSYSKVDEFGAITYITGEQKSQYDQDERKIPFDVNSKWEKMSKSKGNVIDPLDMITSYGTDALRLTLAAITTQAQQIDLDTRKFEEFQNFTNKIWNGARFVFMNIKDLRPEELAKGIDPEALQLEDRWILSTLNKRIKEITTNLENYRFDEATAAIYQFFWDQFCAYYVEISKPVLFGKAGTQEQRVNKQRLLVFILSSALRLLHPFAPFITEEIYQKLQGQFGSVKSSQEPLIDEILTALQATSCAVATFPKVTADPFEIAQEQFVFVEKVVHALRSARAEMGLHPADKIELSIVGNDKDPDLHLLKESVLLLTALVKPERITFLKETDSLPTGSTTLVKGVRFIIPLSEEMKTKELTRLLKEEEKLIELSNRVRVQLHNEEYLAKAPVELVNKMREKLQLQESQLSIISKKLSDLRQK